MNSIILPSAPRPSSGTYMTINPLTVLCLLDNGLVVEVEITPNTTFSDLYRDTMTLAKQSPLYSSAQFENVEFTMLYYTQSGEEKHGLGSETLLSTLDGENVGPLLNVIKFEKRSSRNDEYTRMASILHCDVEDIQSLMQLQDKNDRKEIENEVHHFRRTSHILAFDSVLKRIETVKAEKVDAYKHLVFLRTVCPFQLPSKIPKLDRELETLLQSNVRNIELIHYENANNAFQVVLPDMDYLTTRVSDVLAKAIPLIDLETTRVMNGHAMGANGHSSLMSSKYVIKVFGCEIYFTEDVLFIEVPEIVQQLTHLLFERQKVVMQLVLCNKTEVVEKYNYSKFIEWSLKESELKTMKHDFEKAEKRQQQNLRKKTVSISTLSPEERYFFHPSAVMLGDEVEAELRGDNYWVTVTSYLTFGDTIITSCTFPTKKKNEAQWALQEGQTHGKTEVSVRSLPRSATLCFIVTISKTEKPSQYDYVKKFWANFCIFDQSEFLKSGPNNLHLWELPQDQVVMDQPNLTGTTIDNFRTFQKKHESGVRLVISCMSSLQKTHKNVYKFENLVSQDLNVQWLNKINRLTHVNLSYLSNIDERPPEEKVWMFKQAVEYFYQRSSNQDNIFYGQTLINWIPQIVKCVDFSDADMVHNLKLILETCQPGDGQVLKTDQCLVLLGFHCQDTEVRKFAVKHLEKKRVSELKTYLLQICECLKFERYLINDLTELLLKKSFENHSFAHALFWNLRVFLFDEHHWLRTCLIIEALFYGIPDYQSLLEKPLAVMEKLRSINSKLKKLESHSSNEKQSFILQEFLEANQRVLSDWLCPLCPSKYLSALEPTECKCMKSKMKPVRLVYSTEESVQALKSVPTFASSTLQLLGSHQSQHPYCYELMFKVGDDLRQDVLILQMFSCFNSLWLQHDLDLKLLSYKCVAAELDAGLIEMVQNASTISKIQQWYNEEKKKAFGSLSVAWSRDVIYLWLASDICNGNKPLPNEIIEKATTEFILSCAGSCVASYVLGIGDRHNDNIMVHRSGRLFHIDFGHILGRKKSKFGINRERVPLILPASFMYIINRDYEANNDQSPSYRRNFEFFKRLLIQAFMVLRDNVDMVCNMLYAMKNAGMPELKSLSDVNYVRETLFVGDTREEAEKKFVQKINDSTKSSWTVNVNWATHNYKHWK